MKLTPKEAGTVKLREAVQDPALDPVIRFSLERQIAQREKGPPPVDLKQFEAKEAPDLSFLPPPPFGDSWSTFVIAILMVATPWGRKMLFFPFKLLVYLRIIL